ncbi:MAG: LysR family transcriptional regulator [Burkholderiales bacterium]|nr:LysR family transcriptional regulator [Burkholderiales bacterium]MCC7116750.1 LysR family transcriptional regulator [Burkholderiales bacterium]
MRAFVVVVEQGSFARAADRLDQSVSSVSRQIADLEAHLDARLLNRTTRRLSLTEAGRDFHERSVQLLADLDEAEQAAGGVGAAPRGTLKLTAPITYGVRVLAPRLASFTARYPDVRLDIELSDRAVDLVDEGFDLAVRIGAIRNPNLVARRVGETRLVCCASPAYLAAHGTPATPADLARHACLTYEYAPVRSQWRFVDANGAEQIAKVAGPMHGNNGEMLAALAAQGAGVTLEPDFIVEPLIASGRLVPILVGYEVPPIPIHAAYPSRRHLSAKVRAFIDHLVAGGTRAVSA